MSFVLVHGGGHSSRCWEPTIPLLDAPALAVDLPGRGVHPAPLDTVGVTDWVDAVVGDIRAARDRGEGEEGFVLVGHSMAGLALPGVLAEASDLIRHVVFIACAIPPDGGSLLDTVPDEVRAFADAAVPSPAGSSLSPDEVRAMQCYDMDEDQTRFTLEVVVPEAFVPISQPISLAGLARPVPRTWVKTLRDQSFPPDVQAVMAARAGCDTVVELDSGHVAMISHPHELAAILNEVHGGA